MVLIEHFHADLRAYLVHAKDISPELVKLPFEGGEHEVWLHTMSVHWLITRRNVPKKRVPRILQLRRLSCQMSKVQIARRFYRDKSYCPATLDKEAQA